MGDLTSADFGAYFEAVHERQPFPWQARLLAEVAATGAWPALLDLPTGTGKTAAIDVAVFHLALDPARAPRRVVLVVDRRTVVDQAFERAQKIAGKLRAAAGGVLGEVADRLRALAGAGADPLAVAELRGGMPRDDGWARRPDQPLVAASTVDQVGSRLLFRGYGVSEAMRPIHAGLVGNDALILLDEVHLSQPFRETLDMLRGLRGPARRGLPDRFRVVEMSATPGGERRDAFGLDGEDRRDEVLARRLRAQKPVEIAEPAKRGAFAEACAERAAKLAAPGRVVGVVVNRVATAGEVFDGLRRRLGDRARLFLVTGRMRPLDRDDLDRALGPLVRSERARAGAGAPPVVVVSTQCIEAGADFDFDALVTECASLDALRQRFGRLNRLGEIEDARGVVLARAESLGKEADPLYGDALKKTWAWLQEAPRDFGVDALEMPPRERLAEMLVEPRHAPVMLPAHLDLWAQTWPTPAPDPDVSLWLHGKERRTTAEVQVVWRADVSEAALRSEGALDALLARLDVCPPAGLEAITVPLHAVRAWLTDERAEDLADVEGLAEEEADGRRREKPRGRPALLWRGEESRVVGAGDLHPGATLVVPSAYGGLTERSWDPSSKAAVVDLGDRARWRQTGRAVLRLDGAVHPGWAPLPTPADPDDAGGDDRANVIAWLAALSPGASDGEWLPAALSALRRGRRGPAIVRLPAIPSSAGEPSAGACLAVIGRGRAGDATTEDDGASHTGVAMPLHEHMKGVADWARGFAERCGLPPEVTRDLELAGRWHDAGKVDPRFQRMLHGGSAFKAEVAPEPLAKSATVAGDRAARARARERSGYPRGARHELASVALLTAGASLLDGAADRDLVLHLVASHHGWCRPFAPVAPDPEPVELALDTGGAVVRASSDHGLARLDAGVTDRFWRLVGRYGWLGLAWLEAILRLADHRRSEEEQQPKEVAR